MLMISAVCCCARASARARGKGTEELAMAPLLLSIQREVVEIVSVRRRQSRQRSWREGESQRRGQTYSVRGGSRAGDLNGNCFSCILLLEAK